MAAERTSLQDAYENVGVVTTDPRLSDARVPLSHTHAEADVTGLAADLAARTQVVFDSGIAYESRTAAIPQFTAYTAPAAGRYRVSVYAVAAAVVLAGLLTSTVQFSDGVQAQTATVDTTSLVALGTLSSGNTEIRAVAGSTIKLQTTYAGTGTYHWYATVERLS